MLVFQDRSFCPRRCGNKECRMNLMNVPNKPPFPVALRGGLEDCQKWQELKSLKGVSKFARGVWKNE